jgi:hypothetical protein
MRYRDIPFAMSGNRPTLGKHHEETMLSAFQIYSSCRRSTIIVCMILVLQKVHAQQGVLFRPNPFPDRYFFMPSGIQGTCKQ